MLLIVGALVVLGSVAGGYLMEGGKLLVLEPAGRVRHHRRRRDRQPADRHAAVGAQAADRPDRPAVQERRRAKTDYTELLAMLYQLFKVAQQRA